MARYVVGRAGTREGEQSLPSEAVAEAIQRFTREGLTVAPRKQLGGNSDQLALSRVTREPIRVGVANDLSPTQAYRVTRHEVGHLFDEMSGQIPVSGLSRVRTC